MFGSHGTDLATTGAGETTGAMREGQRAKTTLNLLSVKSFASVADLVAATPLIEILHLG